MSSLNSGSSLETVGISDCSWGAGVGICNLSDDVCRGLVVCGCGVLGC